MTVSSSDNREKKMPLNEQIEWIMANNAELLPDEDDIHTLWLSSEKFKQVSKQILNSLMNEDWISIEDELPDKVGKVVIATDGKVVLEVLPMFFYPKEYEDYISDMGFTHWMPKQPLPMLPKKEE